MKKIILLSLLGISSFQAFGRQKDHGHVPSEDAPITHTAAVPMIEAAVEHIVEPSIPQTKLEQLIKETQQALLEASIRADERGELENTGRLLMMAEPKSARFLLNAFHAVQNVPLFGITTEASEAPFKIVQDREAGERINKLAKKLSASEAKELSTMVERDGIYKVADFDWSALKPIGTAAEFIWPYVKGGGEIALEVLKLVAQEALARLAVELVASGLGL